MNKLLLSLIFTLLSANLYALDSYYKINTNVSDAGIVNQFVSSMSDQLTQNKDIDNISGTHIAITSFVNIDNFDKTSKLGNIVTENLIHEMQIRGYKIIDYKTRKGIKIDKQGDFIFSRDIKNLTQSLKINYVLSGTCTNYMGGIVINARIVDLKTHLVLSTAQIMIPKKLVNKINHKPKKIINFVAKPILKKVEPASIELTQ
ncbi:MAG: FlgO family outer membrane protein [Campylobacterota bacterium]|nr:FlgO family outer membrane protein [Campylobacterota bacterium]